MIKSKKIREISLDRSRKTHNLKTMDKELFHGLGSLIRMLVEGGRKQLSDTL